MANGSMVSATIGAAGGSLSATDGKLALTIPAGALATNTIIGIQPITNMAHGKIGAAYQLTPDGQTFLKPMTLTFAYTDEDLKGTAAKFLGAAFQTADGYWQWFGDATVDTTARTVSVASTHFTGVSAVRRLVLLPTEKTVKVKKSVALRVQFCFGPAPAILPGSGGELVYLGRDCGTRGRQREIPGGVSKWSVNTIEGGDAVLGTVSGSGNTATYFAPATKPSPNTVAVSAIVDLVAGRELVASSITIKEDTLTGRASSTTPFYSVTADVVWTLESTVDKVATYRPSGTATLSGALYSGFGCIYSPLTGPIDSGSGAVLIIDYNPDPPTYHGGGATSWPGTLTCPPNPVVQSVTLTALYFGGGKGPLGTEAQGLVSGEGTIIEGTDTMGDVIFNWKFILD